jgi:hypothetical protein
VCESNFGSFSEILSTRAPAIGERSKHVKFLRRRDIEAASEAVLVRRKTHMRRTSQEGKEAATDGGEKEDSR